MGFSGLQVQVACDELARLLVAYLSLSLTRRFRFAICDVDFLVFRENDGMIHHVPVPGTVK